jgi:hypothetical protein
MMSSRTIKRVTPWVLGLYFMAQIVGVALLGVVHLNHIYQSQIAIADDIALAGVVDHGHEHDGHHRHGTSDSGDQCCTSHHHLSAILFEPNVNPGGFARTSLALALPDVLIGGEPAFPDRPPKLLLSI